MVDLGEHPLHRAAVAGLRLGPAQPLHLRHGRGAVRGLRDEQRPVEVVLRGAGRQVLHPGDGVSLRRSSLLHHRQHVRRLRFPELALGLHHPRLHVLQQRPRHAHRPLREQRLGVGRPGEDGPGDARDRELLAAGPAEQGAALHRGDGLRDRGGSRRPHSPEDPGGLHPGGRGRGARRRLNLERRHPAVVSHPLPAGLPLRARPACRAAVLLR
mmetsp:Transcript_38184/g.83206  ORF Transcript_38184/g.83206 Transcript_38184/m.83206 type:complete len:213 (+) Transcript_38184:590-1228(+)